MAIFKYHKRIVPAHGDATGPAVLLVNEAPGPSEAISGIPSFGQQGANIFHALRAGGISWASKYGRFVWPRNGEATQSKRHELKVAFLAERAKYMTCTNAFARWPRPKDKLIDFCTPLDVDVLSADNLNRLKGEIATTHKAILICGRSAYLACVGFFLAAPANRELTQLTTAELSSLNVRLGAKLTMGWYMGHTRRWSSHGSKTANTLAKVAAFVGWDLVPNLTT
jgi:hypothetical protein